MGDSLPWTPTNRREKFDSASFIPGGEIRNRTNTQKTHKLTVADIFTPCLSARVDNKILSINYGVNQCRSRTHRPYRTVPYAVQTDH